MQNTSGKHGFLRHAAIYGVGAVALQISSALLLPLYTHYLSPSDYGVLDILERVGNVITVLLLGNGLQSATFSFYCQAKSAEERVRTFSTITVVLWGFLIAGFLCALLFSRLLARGLGVDEPALVVMGICVVLLQAAVTFPLTLIQARLESATFAIMSLLIAVVRMLAIILAVSVLHLGVWGVFASSALCFAFFAVVLTWREARRGVARPDQPTAMAIIRFALPLLPTGILGIIMSSADRFFLLTYTSVTAVGVYALGSKLAMLAPQFASMPLWKVWTARLYDLHASPDAPHRVGRTITRLLAVHVFFCLGISIFAYEVVHLVASAEYASAYQVIPILALGSVFYLAGDYFDGSFLARRNTKPKPIISAITTVVGLALLYLWTEEFTAIGVASAVTVSSIVRAFVTLMLAQRVAFIVLDWPAILKGSVLAVGLFGLTSALPTNLAMIILKFGCWLTWPAMLWLVGAFDEHEKNWFRFQAVRIRKAVPIKI